MQSETAPGRSATHVLGARAAARRAYRTGTLGSPPAASCKHPVVESSAAADRAPSRDEPWFTPGSRKWGSCSGQVAGVLPAAAPPSRLPSLEQTARPFRTRIIDGD
jgi:hypothetical protein